MESLEVKEPAQGLEANDGAPPGRPVSSGTSVSRKFADAAGKWLVQTGGVLIIASILGILLFILVETWPLLSGADITAGRERRTPTVSGRGILTDEYLTQAAMIDKAGVIVVVDLESGEELLREPLPLREDETAEIEAVSTDGLLHAFSGKTRDGAVFFAPVHFRISFLGEERQVTPAVEETRYLQIDTEGRPLGAYAVRMDEEGSITAAAQLASGRLAVVRITFEENMFTEEVTEIVRRHELDVEGELTALVLDETGRNLFGGTAKGDLHWWPLRDGTPQEAQVSGAGPSGITSLALLLGGRSLIAGQEDGTLGVWFITRSGDTPPTMNPIREFRGSGSPVRLLAPSPRDKGFAALYGDGNLGLYHSTAHRTLWSGEAPIVGADSLFFAPKADALFLVDENGYAEIRVDNPHPEVSFRTLFGKVWYEGYDKPDHVWQSSSATDDFEPKLSLTPLLIGSLKGTFYSLLLAIPLGVLGAMYASQFMHPSLRRYVKPTVEIMAALPSVVLGFLAGLWLAPRVERAFGALLLMLVILPLFALASGFLYSRLSPVLRSRVPMGTEALVAIIFLAAGGWLAVAISGPLESMLFDGPFKDWLQTALGVTYDQRNAVVVGIGMGFAVIPIIFSVAEDAFSNVPRNLVAGSLAMGATRWQTVTRIVLPTASPGIFSAIMIGFGRAVGETMIVLMATGNTPIMDWSPFNGFRTLSANIAVEIPEAPHGGTLYRTLFLAALLLFLLTFLVNTAAELVRQHLRKRYADL